jgi:hypothetical protein
LVNNDIFDALKIVTRRRDRIVAQAAWQAELHVTGERGMANLVYGRKAVWDEILALKDGKSAKKAAIAYLSKGANLQYQRGNLVVVRS